MENNTPTEVVKSQAYIPSSLEKKRVVLAYFLLGIFVYLTGRDITPYEGYHIRWSIGRWMLFLLSLFVFIVPVLLIPLFWVLVLLVYIPLVGIWFYNVSQARAGKYKGLDDKSPLALMNGLGGRFFDVFEIDPKQKAEAKAAVEAAEAEAEVAEPENENAQETESDSQVKEQISTEQGRASAG